MPVQVLLQCVYFDNSLCYSVFLSTVQVDLSLLQTAQVDNSSLHMQHKWPCVLS